MTARVVGMLSEAGGQGVVYQPGGSSSVYSWLVAILRLWKPALLGRVQQLYLVCSRSNGGFLRDLPAYLLILFGSRVVVHAHGSDIVDLCRRPWIGRFARFFLSRCVLVLPSVHLLAPLCELGIANAVCCENFFEPSIDQFVVTAPDAKEVSPALVVLWNSNVMASKGFFVLAEAVGMLARSGGNVRLLALGRCIGDEVMDEGTSVDRLEALRHEPWISYLGQVSRAESARLLDEVDIVCLPSTYASECQPLAIIEAMCAGRPIVIANTPALCATVGNYPCVKVDVPVKPDALANAILRCGEEVRGEALAVAAKAARERFSPDRFDREMSALLRLDRGNLRESK